MERTTVHFRSGTKIHKALRLAAAILVLIMVGLAGKADARPGLPPEPDSPWFVDMNRFALSAHTGFKCEECH
ncbi:MAG: hypothetical protein WAM73_13375, partial [Desulfobacterales bacterium]